MSTALSLTVSYLMDASVALAVNLQPGTLLEKMRAVLEPKFRLSKYYSGMIKLHIATKLSSASYSLFFLSYCLIKD